MSDTGKTGYRDVKEVVLARIRARIWQPGHAIPGELELAEEFSVARGTVNRAMLELMDEGVIVRKRKAGTRVALSPVRHARLEIPLVRAEIESTGAAYGYERLTRKIVQAPKWLTSRLSLPDKVRMVHLRCRHFADATPFQFEDRWINIDAVADAESELFIDTNPNEWLVRTVPFTDAEFAFQAEAADADTANLLAIEKGDPVFVAERTTWLAGKPVTFARMFFRQNYRMVTRI